MKEKLYLILALIQAFLCAHSIIEGWALNAAVQSGAMTAFLAIVLYRNREEDK